MHCPPGAQMRLGPQSLDTEHPLCMLTHTCRSLQVCSAPHCALLVQATQTPAAVLHAGVGAVHRVVLVAEHWPHAPPGWQAGVAPPHSLSPAQARQVCVVVLQTGVAPLHAVALVAEHCPHAPDG